MQVYTPLAWVRQLSANAARQGRKLDIATLEPGALLPVVRVLVYPDTPRFYGESVSARVGQWTKAGGRKPYEEVLFTYRGLAAAFGVDAVRQVRGAAGADEFVINVIGETGEKKQLVVKRKHFHRLM